MSALPKISLGTDRTGIRMIGVAHIVADESLQSRVVTDMDWCRELSARFIEGNFPPPITVYILDGKYCVASGFHRLRAAILAKMTEIQCDVRQGSRDDAMACSAGSNIGNGKKPMTTKDLKKSLLMLLDVKEWHQRPAVDLSEHIGVSKGTALRWRTEYFSAKGLAVPETICRDGSIRIPSRGGRSNNFRTVSTSGNVSYRGKSFFVGKKLSGKIVDASRELEKLPKGYVGSRWDLEDISYVSQKIARFGIPASVLSTRHNMSLFSCVDSENFAASIALDASKETLACAVCALMLAKQTAKPGKRLVVIGYYIKTTRAIELFGEMGIEFMTPEELIESLTPKDN